MSFCRTRIGTHCSSCTLFKTTDTVAYTVSPEIAAGSTSSLSRIGTGAFSIVSASRLGSTVSVRSNTSPSTTIFTSRTCSVVVLTTGTPIHPSNRSPTTISGVVRSRSLIINAPSEGSTPNENQGRERPTFTSTRLIPFRNTTGILTNLCPYPSP